jgi:hypothetical protein
MSKIRSLNWKRTAKRGFQVALLVFVPGGSLVVLLMWWLEQNREVPFEVHP